MKSITENLALFSIVAISFGFYRLYRFYMVFGINITSYIDLSEVLQLDYLFLLVIFISIFLFALFGIPASNNKIKISDSNSISNYIQSLSNYEYYKIGLTLIIIFFFILLFGAVFSTTDAHNIKDGKPEYKVIITKEDRTIKSDTILVYVGKTKNYLFLYDRNKKSSLILKMDDIKELETSNTRYFSPL